MQKKISSVQRFHQRPGEGHPVEFVVDGVSSDSLRGTLDLSGLPVPDRRFACDAISLQLHPDRARLLLAQWQPVGSSLLSMLVINMAPEAVVQFLGSVPPTFTTKPGSGEGSVPRPASLVDFKENAAQSVVLTSSLLMAGYSGQSACIDFYYASPFSVQSMAALKKISLEPVVRVNLTTSNLFGLIDGLRAAATRFGWSNENV